MPLTSLRPVLRYLGAWVVACLLGPGARQLAAQNPTDNPPPATNPAPQPAPPPPPPAAAPAVRVTGVVYAQGEYWPSDSLNHTNQFDVTRAYVNVLGSFSKGISTRITGDVFRSSTNADKTLGYRLKYAYVQWLPSATAPVDFRLGMTQTPFIDWEESLYGFRMQGTMPMERAGFETSSDIGAAMDFFSKDKGLNGSVAVVNGEGYANPPGGRFMDVEGRASVRLLQTDDNSNVGGLRLTGYGHYGRVDQKGGPARNRAVGMVSYKSKLLTLAGEVGVAKNGVTSTTAPGPAVHALLVAAYGVLDVPNSPVQLLARVDHLDPNTRSFPGTTTCTSSSRSDCDASTRFIGGVAYRVSPNFRVLGDVDAVKYQADTSVLTTTQYAQRTRLLGQIEFTF
jgi:hypothetical protein